VAMFRVCICVDKGGRGSQPDSTETQLDQSADGDDEVWCP
jgi:hypothetical protein